MNSCVQTQHNLKAPILEVYDANGQGGIDQTLLYIGNYYHCNYLFPQASKFIDSCDPCLEIKYSNTAPLGFVIPQNIATVSEWRITMDGPKLFPMYVYYSVGSARRKFCYSCLPMLLMCAQKQF